MSDPLRGDLVEISWLDICEDVVGDPDEAKLSRRTSYALFWERRKDEHGVEVLVTTTTMDDDLSGQNGYCIYPALCVTRMKVIKRARKPRAKRVVISVSPPKL